MPKGDLLVIYIATLTALEETFGRKSWKKSLKCQIFHFLSKKDAFFGLFLGTRLDDLLDFAPQKGILLHQAYKKIQN